MVQIEKTIFMICILSLVGGCEFVGSKERACSEARVLEKATIIEFIQVIPEWGYNSCRIMTEEGEKHFLGKICEGQIGQTYCHSIYPGRGNECNLYYDVMWVRCV